MRYFLVFEKLDEMLRYALWIGLDTVLWPILNLDSNYLGKESPLAPKVD